MTERIFVVNESGQAHKLSNEELEELELRNQFAKDVKKDWVQKLLKITNTTPEQWINKQVAEKLEKRKQAKENIEI